MVSHRLIEDHELKLIHTPSTGTISSHGSLRFRHTPWRRNDRDESDADQDNGRRSSSRRRLSWLAVTVWYMYNYEVVRQ